jgi:hypothetical protein
VATARRSGWRECEAQEAWPLPHRDQTEPTNLPVRWDQRCSSCSAVLVATNFIVGRCTASAIASPSPKSALLDKLARISPASAARHDRAIAACGSGDARLASRASTWPRDHFCRSTIAPRLGSAVARLRSDRERQLPSKQRLDPSVNSQSGYPDEGNEFGSTTQTEGIELAQARSCSARPQFLDYRCETGVALMSRILCSRAQSGVEFWDRISLPGVEVTIGHCHERPTGDSLGLATIESANDDGGRNRRRPKAHLRIHTR